MEQKKLPDKTLQYDKFYVQLRQATHIGYIDNYEECFYKLHESTKIIYTFLLQRFLAGNSKFMYLSCERIAAECALSERTVITRIKELHSLGVIETSTKRSTITGRNTTTKYTNIVDLITDTRFKLYSESMKNYYTKLKTKQERLNSLADYVKCNLRDQYNPNWSDSQFKNFWRNTHHELITGEYLKGFDKSAGLLYKPTFTLEWLEDFEIDLLKNEISEGKEQ